MTNLRLATLDGSRATVAYFLTAYESRPTEQGGAPRLVAIRECQDTLVAPRRVAAAGQAQPPPSAARMSAGCRASGTESQLSNHSPRIPIIPENLPWIPPPSRRWRSGPGRERGRSQVRQLSLDHPDITIADAYAIQREWVASKIAAGRRLVGHKIGLTSRAMQLSSQIDEPDYGALLDDMLYGDGAEIPRDRYIVPRVEVELAFILERRLQRAGRDAVRRAGRRALRDSRAGNHRRALAPDRSRHQAPAQVFDTIADNAANAGVVMGGRPVRVGDTDLRWVGAMMSRNAVIEETGLAAGVLNHPANGVVWLANKLAEHDVALEAGQIILSGSFTRPVYAERGDTFHVDYGALGAVSCRFV